LGGEAMEAVILASGKSRRLSVVTGGRTKCLLKIMGFPLYKYALNVMTIMGIQKIHIVVRDEDREEFSQQLKELDIDTQLIVNKNIDYGNAYSTILGLEKASTEKVIIACCDTIAPPTIFKLLMECYKKHGIVNALYVAASKNPEYIDYKEATKIITNNLFIKDIGKKLERSDYIDTGIMILDKRLSILKKTLDWKKEKHLFQLIRTAIIDHGYKGIACNVGLTPWTEIDTPEDLEDLLHGKKRRVLEEYWREMRMLEH
jgi:choline kinase